MITQTSEYALRAIVNLAMRPDGGPASAQEIATETRVPVGYLQKVLRSLAKARILTAQRGSGGGFTLAREPEDITMLDVLRASDTGVDRITACPLGLKSHANLCALHRLLDRQIEAAERTFAGTSIADLLNDESGVRPLCNARHQAVTHAGATSAGHAT